MGHCIDMCGAHKAITQLRRTLIRSNYASTRTPVVVYTHDGITGTLTLVDPKARSLSALRTATFACVDHATALVPALRRLTLTTAKDVLLLGVCEKNPALNAMRRLNFDLSYWRMPSTGIVCEADYQARTPTGVLVA